MDCRNYKIWKLKPGGSVEFDILLKFRKLKFHMRKPATLISLLLVSFMLHAQKNYAVMVTDSKTGKAIAGAAIKILSTGKVTATSASGNVVMLISADDSLLVSFKGYKERKLQMAGQFIALSIILDPVPVKDKIAAKPKKKKTVKPSD